MSELKLKKCPFCGKPGMLHRTMLGWQIYCAGFCGCQLEANDHDRRVVINKWNTRSNTKEELQTAANTTKVETVVSKQCHAYTEHTCDHRCENCKEYF